MCAAYFPYAHALTRVEKMSEPKHTLNFGPECRPWRETVSEVAVAENGELLVSAPSDDPLQLDSYPDVPGLTSHLFQVPSSGITPEQRERALKETLVHLSKENHYFLSSQGDLHFKCNSAVKQYSKTLLLSGGDPFVDGPCGLNMKWMERNVLDFLASIWHAKWPHNPTDPESYWGYVMSLDTTESAYYCLQSARDYLSGKFISQTFNPSSNEADPRKVDVYCQGKYNTDNPNAYKPVVFFTSEAHQSIAMAAHLVNIPTFHDMGVKLYPNECPLSEAWPQYVPCEGGDAGPGTVDVKSLGKLVDFFSGKGHPILVVFNYGSCFKGACDDVKLAGEVLIPILKKNGMLERTLQVNKDSCLIRNGFWFHVDGIMAAFYMPFFEMAYHKGLIVEKPGPVFDFRLDHVTSLAANFHTWGGSPWPCAVYITRSSHQLHKTVSHYGFFDTVLSGARNVLSSVLLWSHYASIGCEEQVQRVVQYLTAVQDLERKFKVLESEIGTDLWITRLPHSFVLRFRKPIDEIVRKYHLVTKTYFIDGEVRDYAQVCQVDKMSTNALLEDLHQPNSFPACGIN